MTTLEKYLIFTLMTGPAPDAESRLTSGVLAEALRHGLEHCPFEDKDKKEIASHVLGAMTQNEQHGVNYVTETESSSMLFGDLQCVAGIDIPQDHVFDLLLWRQLQDGRAEFVPSILRRFTLTNREKFASISVHLSFHLPRFEPALLVYGKDNKMQGVLTHMHPTAQPPAGCVFLRETLMDWEEEVVTHLTENELLKSTGELIPIGISAFEIYELLGDARETYDLQIEKIPEQFRPKAEPAAAR